MFSTVLADTEADGCSLFFHFFHDINQTLHKHNNLPLIIITNRLNCVALTEMLYRCAASLSASQSAVQPALKHHTQTQSIELISSCCNKTSPALNWYWKCLSPLVTCLMIFLFFYFFFVTQSNQLILATGWLTQQAWLQKCLLTIGRERKLNTLCFIFQLIDF